MKKLPLIIIPLLCQLGKADNIAPSGSGIIGTHTAIDGTLGTPYVRTDQPDGTTVRINDGVNGTEPSMLSSTHGTARRTPPTLLPIIALLE